MARIDDPRALPVYRAAERITERVLRRNASVFTTRRLWTAALAAELCARLDRALAADGTFDQRWARVTHRASDETLLGAAELLYVHVLFAADLRPRTKRALVGAALDRMRAPVPLPPPLDEALGAGLAPTGVAFKTLRLSQLRVLAEAVRCWKELPAARRRDLLADAWALKDWLAGIPHGGGVAQREALLHLVHPEAFEPIVSPAMKRKIVAGFDEWVPAEVTDVDAALLSVRAALTARHGPSFTFFDDRVAADWR